MTNNIKIATYQNSLGESFEAVTIDHGNGEFTSMLKSAYDELQAQTNRMGVVTNGDN